MKNNSRPIKVRVHFNRINMQRRNPAVWTVHTSKACIQAERVVIRCQLETTFKGFDATQPRAFFTGHARVRIAGKTVFLE